MEKNREIIWQEEKLFSHLSNPTRTATHQATIKSNNLQALLPPTREDG
jgi:hypothetical protein